MTASIETLLAAAVVVGCAVWGARTGWGFWPLVLTVVAAVVAVCAMVVGLLRRMYEYDFTRFLIGSDSVRVRHGWLWRAEEMLPYSRVQHVDMEQGPILRVFDLTSVRISVAAGEQRIAGLAPHDAQAVTQRILDHVRTAKEDL